MKTVKKKNLYILMNFHQIKSKKIKVENKKEFSSALVNIEKKLNNLLQKNLTILSGNFTLCSNMTDWNPA